MAILRYAVLEALRFSKASRCLGLAIVTHSERAGSRHWNRGVVSDAMSAWCVRRWNGPMPTMKKRTPGVANELLATLEPKAFARLSKKLTRTALEVKQVLYKPGERIREVYFPDDAVIVLLALDARGRTIESGTVGREGASWISASVSAPSMPCETVVAIEGHAHRLAVKDLDDELQKNPGFQHVLTQYSHALLVASMRTTGCTGLHDLPQRCARWMLHTLDRVSGDRFSVTHDFLASLMGSSRPTISLIMQTFERAGIVSVHRRSITVIDRARLEAVSCECYKIIRKHYEEVGML
jgi:CRP-like cAMP-binding protein